MKRDFYINLANSGLKMPIGTDLVLHEKENPDAILNNGELLGKVIEEAARRFKTPLAFPLMDLMLEKTIMLEMIGIPHENIDTYHFDTCPGDPIFNLINESAGSFITKRMKADIDAIEYIANKTDLIPIGMSIGPVSLMTKLLGDPITAIYLAATGLSAKESEEVKMIERAFEMSILIITKYIELKIKAGAKATAVAEPAANKIFFSPRQIESGSDIFERYFSRYNFKIKELLDKYNVDLIFHCCGEITDYMLKKFIELNPIVMSLGSSRKLWEDATIVPKDIVLFGNLPSKKFFSDQEISLAEVHDLAAELIFKMKEAKHPFILGSECDVLCVDGYEQTIKEKVETFLKC